MGVLFQDRINDSPYKYTGQVLQATNPCSVQMFGACKTLGKFGENPLGKIPS